MDDKRMAWIDNFNPLQWGMDLLISAKQSEDGRYTSEFMLDEPLSKTAQYNYCVVFHYLMDCCNTPDKRVMLILLNKENSHLYGMCDINGIPEEIFERYEGKFDEENSSLDS